MLFFLLVGLVLLPGSRRSSGNNRKGETQHKRSRCFNTTVVLQRRDVCLCAEYGYIILTTLPPSIRRLQGKLSNYSPPYLYLPITPHDKCKWHNPVSSQDWIDVDSDAKFRSESTGQPTMFPHHGG